MKSCGKRLEITAVLLFLAGLLVSGQWARADSLWLGNDTVGPVYHTDTLGNVLGSVATPVTGIAWDGSSLFFSNSTGGTTKRTPDGVTVLDSFTVAPFGSPTEDLAWDSTRGRIWRIDHAQPYLVRINPTTGLADMSFALSTTDPTILGVPGLTPLGGLGIAYDSTRDLLYASFCQQGCAQFTPGLISAFSPVDGSFQGVVARPGFGTGGLGYDPLTDTLWVGSLGNTIYNIQRDGTILSSFTKPAGSGFTDGLEFVPTSVPEPAMLVMLGTGLLALCGASLKKKVI